MSGHGHRDPRRGAIAVNPLAHFERNDVCWCLSGLKYKDCHQIRGLREPGAPTPLDDDEGVFISPDTKVHASAFQSKSTVPILMQQPQPQAAPVSISGAAAALVGAPQPQGLLTFGEIASSRFAVFDVHGITDHERVRRGDYDADLAILLPDLVEASYGLARATIERLVADQRDPKAAPVVLRLDDGDVARMVGQTLFWADRYLVDDRIAALHARGVQDPATYRSPVADLLRLRPLIDSGIVVPVYAELAVALTAQTIDVAVRADLATAEYVDWVKQQIVIEGPTAREAAFVHVVDDYPHNDWFYLLNRVQPGGDRTHEGADLHGRLLGRYDRDHNYEPWLATVRHQATAQLTKTLNEDLAIAMALGAQPVTSSPFRARALNRRRSPQADNPDYEIRAAVWADVPWLPDAAPTLLAKIAADDDRVHDLRARTAAALRGVAADDTHSQAQAIADLAADLRSAGAGLTRNLRKLSVLDAVTPAGLATGSVLIGGTIGPVLLAGAGLAGLAAAVPPTRARLGAQGKAGYAFWLAWPRRRV